MNGSLKSYLVVLACWMYSLEILLIKDVLPELLAPKKLAT